MGKTFLFGYSSWTEKHCSYIFTNEDTFLMSGKMFLMYFHGRRNISYEWKTAFHIFSLTKKYFLLMENCFSCIFTNEKIFLTKWRTAFYISSLTKKHFLRMENHFLRTERHFLYIFINAKTLLKIYSTPRNNRFRISPISNRRETGPISFPTNDRAPFVGKIVERLKCFTTQRTTPDFLS